ncbi:MAG: excinuclease ABC subunit C, partial [Hyphomicrobiales bacterium]|nr:excinuclease ABC subunit C [Hyphomicrobiales bacterium]
CVEAFFFRNFQNWGNRAYFPKADPGLGDAEVLSAFLAQFYDDKPTPKLILLSHEIDEQELLREALSARSGVRLEIIVPKRGEKRDLVAHAGRNAAEALARRLADTSSQEKLLAATGAAFGLDKAPRRIEVYDNSHIMGTNAIGALIVAGPQGFMKPHYRTFNIKSEELTPGDDYAMMREVLKRRFSRLVKENPRGAAPAEMTADVRAPDPAPIASPPATKEQSAADTSEIPPRALDPPPTQFSKRRLGADDSAIYATQALAMSSASVPAGATADPDEFPAWPDLVVIDGGKGQLQAALATLAEVGTADVPVVAIAKGPDRNAGRETFHVPGRDAFRLEPRDPALYFMQRLRDEAHRFAIGTHRAKRSRELVKSPLDEIGGVGPRRKRALLLHFGTVKAIARASLDDLVHAPGVNAATAKAVYSFFHPNA